MKTIRNGIFDLYKVTAEYMRASNSLTELMEEGEIPLDAISNTLEGLMSPIEDIAINIGSHYKNLQAQAKAMKDYETEMRERRKRIEKFADDLKRYLKNAMETCEIKSVKGAEFTISLRKNAPAVFIENEEEVPDEFMRVTSSVDKSLVKEYLKNAELQDDCHWACLKSSTSVTIK